MSSSSSAVTTQPAPADGAETKPVASAMTAIVMPDSELDSGSELSELEGFDSDEDVGKGEDEGDDQEEDDEWGFWESESLFEDALDEMATETFGPDEDAVTPEERKELRTLLKNAGEEKFIEEVIKERGFSIRKALSAFNLRPPAFMEELPERHMDHLLQVVLGREIMRRSRLPHVNAVEHVVELLKKSKNIIVLTGAGISTSLGIPDFRSKGSGLYSRLQEAGLTDPQEVFDIAIFNEDPTIFYSIAKDILPTTNTFSPTHGFIALLQNKGKLLTQYTQNIDNLEMLAGIRTDKLIQCHGSFATASCVKCKHQVPGETIFPELKRGMVAKCDNCLKLLAASKNRKRVNNNSDTWKKRKRAKNGGEHKKKRYSEDSSAEEEEVNFREAGVMKPDITFFGEQLPDTFHKRLINHDRNIADLLICIGTSLKVAPVSETVGFLPAHVPQIYISKTPVNHVEFDVELLGSCDEIVAELCRLAGWTLRHEMVPRYRPEVVWRKLEGTNGNRFEYTTKGSEGNK